MAKGGLAMDTDNSAVDKSNCIYLILETHKGIDFFNQLNRKLIITDTLNEFIYENELTVYVWLLMSNKLYIIVRKDDNHNLADIIIDFKKQTANRIKEELMKSNDEASKTYLELFTNEVTGEFTIWITKEEFIELHNNQSVDTIIDFVHNIPVKEKVVSKPDDYIFSSATDFHGFKGLVDVDSEF